MDSIILSIIDALAQRYGARDTPGWVYVLGAIISIGGAISTKELVKKRKALRKAKAETLNSHELRARLFARDEEGDVEYIGCLRKEATNSYRLVIEAKKNGTASVVSDVTKVSLDEVAEYLRGETKFILADFKQ